MKILDRYVKLDGKIISKAKNMEILTTDPIIEKLIGGFEGTGSVASAEFIKGIPEDIKSEVKSAFGNVYTENNDGYIIKVTDKIEVYSMTDAGLFMGANGLLRHLRKNSLKEGLIYNYPNLKRRGVKVYVPEREQIEYFKEFVDFCAFYGYNTLMMEIGGAMEYKNHPEVNEGWVEYCKRFQGYPGQSLDIQNEPNWARNSIHMENGGGGFLTQDEMKELIAYLRERHFEIIPEMPTLSHCDYMLANHPELRERENDDLPDTYCPSNPDSYKMVFELMDEVIEVFNPKIINIGHDEFFTVGKCDKCKGKDPAKIYADDITKLRDYLATKGIRTMLWSDILLNAIERNGNTGGGAHRMLINMKTNIFMEERPAIYRAIDMIPDDIMMLHWYWGAGIKYEKEFTNRNYEVTFGNFVGLLLYNGEKRRKNFDGTVISNWSLLNRDHLQRNGVLMNIAYTSLLTWSGDFKEENYLENLLCMANDIYEYNHNNMKSYVEFVHHTTVFKDHPPFVDGYFIDKKADYLGSYVIEFESGNSMTIPLYYNLNIGTAKARTERTLIEDRESYQIDNQLIEATYTCGMEISDSEVYYRFSAEIPNSEKVISVKKKEDSEYGKNIVLKEINIVG